MEDIYDEKLKLKWLTNIRTIEDWEMHWQMCVVQLMYYNNLIINGQIRDPKGEKISIDEIYIGKMGRIVELSLSLEFACLMVNHSYLTCISS